MKKNLFKTGLVCFLLAFVLVVLSCDGDDFDDQLKITVTNMAAHNGKLASLDIWASGSPHAINTEGILISNGSATFAMSEYWDTSKPYMKGASHAGMSYRVMIVIFENQTAFNTDTPFYNGYVNNKYIDTPDISINFSEFSVLP